MVTGTTSRGIKRHTMPRLHHSLPESDDSGTIVPERESAHHVEVLHVPPRAGVDKNDKVSRMAIRKDAQFQWSQSNDHKIRVEGVVRSGECFSLEYS